MSERDVEVVRRSFGAWNRGDIEGFIALYHRDCEWDFSRFDGWPEESVYAGHSALRRLFEQWLSAWEDFHVEPQQLRAVGDNRVLAQARTFSRGKKSGAYVESPPFYQLCTLREGKVLRVTNYTDPDEALEAAGLSELDAHAES
jgi:ketosteroid isomerase-like protein